ncbi:MULTISPECIES: antitoxin MazE-like protein [unclassified Caballeronia]|uniref:antitoxin MazE-like protein n=1 Tax=unclassified Caballeronia TaxID=2646786 RepID=UPI0032EABA2D
MSVAYAPARPRPVRIWVPDTQRDGFSKERRSSVRRASMRTCPFFEPASPR